MKITAIILAATEFSGLGPEYFNNKTRHLLPIAGRPLISHLIDVLDDNDMIGEKTIVIGETVKEFKKKLFAKIVTNLC